LRCLILAAELLDAADAVNLRSIRQFFRNRETANGDREIGNRGPVTHKRVSYRESGDALRTAIQRETKACVGVARWFPNLKVLHWHAHAVLTRRWSLMVMNSRRGGVKKRLSNGI